DRQSLKSPFLYLNRRAVDRAVGIINAVVAFLGAQPGQADWAVIDECWGFAGHRFLNLSFAHGAGHDAVVNDAVPLYLGFLLNGKRACSEACAQRQTAKY